jgi:subtilase family serine protease
MNVKAVPLAAARPLVTGSGPDGLFAGGDFRAAYAPGVALTGAGQTVGLFELDGFYAADVAANFKQAGLPPVSVATVLLDGFNGAPGGNNIEVILDIMMAGYMAPGTNVLVYEGFNPDDVLNRMATDNIAKQLSSSWGWSPIDATTEQVFKQMVAQGQSLLQASGDSGAYSGPIMPPADDPNLTVVGGTALTTTGPVGPWLSETTWNDGGGGVSTTYAIPSYQQSMNMTALGGSNTMRNIPDVALLAAIQMFLICNNGEWISVGGTSAAAPLWAGFIALANQQAAANGKPPVGFLNPTIYAIGNGSDYASDLHDIATGSNGFAAIPGFDLATGWGTPAGQPLINDLTSMPSAPSFGLSAAPSAVSLQAGSGASATIQITPYNGFSGAVSLSVSGLPSGVTGTFGSISSSGASQLSLTASSGPAPGSYAISVRGVSGTLTSSVGLSLQVTGTPGFSLQTTPAAVNVTQGGTAAASIAVEPANGFSSTVNLTVSGLPSGVTASFSPAGTTTVSTLSFVASASAAVGATTVTVTGKSGSLSATVAITLTVAAPANFSLAASASTLSVAQGASATDTITVTPKSGFSGKVALTTSGLPNGVTASFNPATTASTSTVTFTAALAATTGTTTVTVTGTAGTLSASVTVSVTVKGAPSVTLGAAPASLSVTQGTSGSSTITVTPVNGFTGAVSLTAGGLPTGVTAAFSPASATSTSTLTLTASASASIGTTTLTITAKSGNVSATATSA